MEIKNIIKEKHFVPILIILDILMTFSTLYVSYTIDSVISNIENSQALGSITIIHIVISISLYVLFTIFVPLLYKVYYYRVKRNYNFYITKKIIEKNSEYFRSNDAGSIINVAYNIGDRIAFYYARVYINIITESISFILVVASMFFYSYKVTLVFLACTLLMSFIISLLAKKVGTASAKLNEKENIVYTKFNQFVENINLIKNLNKEKYYADDYEDNYDNSYYAANKQFSRIDAYYKVVFNDLIIVLPLLILIISILLKDYLGVTISSIVSIYFLSSKIQEPIDSLSSVYSDYKENKINLSYIKDLLVSNDEILKPINDFNKIEFSSKGITFSNNTILNNVKIEISKGDLKVIL